MKNCEITCEQALEMFSYDPESGVLRWREDDAVAGWTDALGYRRVRVGKSNLLVHRLVWFMRHGEWPIYFIDHANGKPGDNRLINLRQATAAQNQANLKLRKDSTSGYRGVFQRSRSKKWFAAINIGTFDSKEEAIAAYERASLFIHGEFSPVHRDADPPRRRPF